jgi:hypothetical protein
MRLRLDIKLHTTEKNTTGYYCPSTRLTRGSRHHERSQKIVSHFLRLFVVVDSASKSGAKSLFATPKANKHLVSTLLAPPWKSRAAMDIPRMYHKSTK